jgi:hypothetical protein
MIRLKIHFAECYMDHRILHPYYVYSRQFQSLNKITVNSIEDITQLILPKKIK